MTSGPRRISSRSRRRGRPDGDVGAARPGPARRGAVLPGAPRPLGGALHHGRRRRPGGLPGGAARRCPASATRAGRSPPSCYGIAAHKVADAQRAADPRLGRRLRPTRCPTGPTPLPGRSSRPSPPTWPGGCRRCCAHLSGHAPGDHRAAGRGRALRRRGRRRSLGMSAAAVRVAQSRALARLRTLAGDALDEVAA